MRFATFVPDPPLSRHVRCVWFIVGPGVPYSPQPILPDGCVEIVLNLGARFQRYRSDGGSELQDPYLLVGPTTEPTVVAPTGTVDLAGIRFHPWGSAALLDVRPAELRDRIVDVTAAARDLGAELAEQVAGCADIGGRYRLITRALATRLARARARTTSSEERVVNALLHLPTYSASAVASLTGLSTRQAARIIERRVGLGLKLLVRVVRFQRALRLSTSSTDVDWSAVALRCGYYDQSHLIRDFRRFAGRAPSALLESDRSLTDRFIAEG